MSCLTQERIQQWVDHELDPVLRRAADEHLAGCEDCRREADALSALVAQAEKLPRSIEPPNDLWPAILVRLTPARPARRFEIPWRQLAAAAAVLTLGVLIGFRMRSDQPTVESSGREIAQVQAPVADSDYSHLASEVKALRQQVETLVASRGQEFDGSTLAAVNDTLAILEKADHEITQAVEREPENQRLRAMRTASVKREAHVLADLMVALNGASMVGMGPTT